MIWRLIYGCFWASATTLAYLYVGYPLILLALYRKSRTAKRPHEGPWPTVTLIIPAFNEELVLRRKIENALAIDYPKDRLEILVASDGSTDQTVPIAEAFQDQGVRTLAFPERRGKASVLNDAVAAAKGEILCLCDANVYFKPDALRRLVERLDDPTVGSASGDVQLASWESNFEQGEASYYRYERMIQEAESQIGSLMGVDGGMYVLRRELFEPLPADTILDDFVVSMQVVRKGQRVVYEADAVASESGTPTARQEYRRRVRVSAGAVQVMQRGQYPRWRQPVAFWQFISHKWLRWMTPILLAVLFASSAALGARHWFYGLALAGQSAVYLFALLGSFIVPLRNTRLGGLPFYFVMGNVGVAQGLWRGIRGSQPVRWAKADRSASDGPVDEPLSKAASP
jgi:cellulose synthase/poly-beta-1,6-N-acetylglucosamine synthase-like glycosyltransferase